MNRSTLQAQARNGKRFERTAIQVDKRTYAMYRPLEPDVPGTDQGEDTDATGRG